MRGAKTMKDKSMEVFLAVMFGVLGLAIIVLLTGFVMFNDIAGLMR